MVDIKKLHLSEELIKDLESRVVDEKVFAPEDKGASLSNKEVLQSKRNKLLYGKRFAEATLDNYIATQEEQATALATCRAYADSIDLLGQYTKYDLILCGKSGTGKSHLSYALAKIMIDKGKEPIIVKFIEIMRRIKTAWSMKNEREQSIIDEYSNCPFLFLEEIGVGYGTENEKLFMFEILDNRYKRKLPTIMTSNLGLEEFKHYIDTDGMGRVWDRLNETAVVIWFNWESYRVKRIQKD